ncbi:MAG: flagellar filament capping protein FliD [Halomonas sp.]|jgi:flagellar hook-associated protein 2|uniref:Flagellar hook-associated protein 2 n=1 Tax=Billgrantia tianxiuensis TaxID=2497861 RepID=A0A6I6SRW3_9GAMM|nr:MULTISPECIES: flagellar filament capping protein FliD [Halomonas]MCE8034508.1 flagellar filament capping protein FliD [Halomonas sp. MCCC 1A11057]MDX5432359.1 flagellar filament capping protein FliD [Halomonas sp.]QHC50387.1 flagellar filament capping protein FliD [Halomonas tianxiuensis]
MATISSLGVGSGLDLNGLLDKLNAAERKKLEPIKLQQKNHQAKISAYGKLQSALTKLQEAAAKLNDPKFFQNVSSNVTGSGLKAAAQSDAPPGRYSVNVSQLATAQSIAANGVESRTTQLGGGNVRLTLGDGEPIDIAIEPGKSSLEDIRKAINDSKSGVTATIVNDGSGTPHRLVITSNVTGTEAAVTAEFSGGLEQHLGASPETVVEAKNASLTVNGIAITSQTNRVEGAIQGVTLDLEETTAEGSSVTVVIERNTLAIREAVSGFVKAYNDLRNTTKGLTKFNADTGAAGELLGDGTLRTVESRLRGVLSGGVGEGEFRVLSHIGITLQRDGTLKLDEEKLSGIVASDPQALAAFFSGESKAGGLAGKLGDTLDQVLRDRGLLDNAKRGLESRITGLKDRHERMEKSIEQTMQRYRAQFGQLDAMVANMNQMSNYLFQQFDMMNAQLGRKK